MNGSGVRKTAAVGLLVVVVLVAIDQASKFWVEANLPFQVRVPLMPFLSMFRTWNEGIAFSFLSFMDDRALVVLTLVIIAFVLWLWARTGTDRRLTQLGYSLIIGGAIGNLIDRAWLGHVVDFIMVHTQNWSFAIFNMADTFITLGAMAIILDELLEFRRSPTGKDNSDTHQE